MKLGKRLGSAIKEIITIVHPRTFARWVNGESGGNRRNANSLNPPHPGTPQKGGSMSAFHEGQVFAGRKDRPVADSQDGSVGCEKNALKEVIGQIHSMPLPEKRRLSTQFQLDQI